MPNWVEVLQTDVLERIGKECTSTRELAVKLGKELKESVTVDALFNAHKRHKDKLSLKASLMDYMGTVDNDPDPVKLEDIRWELSDEKKAEVESATRFIITSSMNNCPVDEPFWASIQNYVDATGACLLVVPIRYKNPTSKGEAINEDSRSWWPEEVEDHMTDELVRLSKNLWLMANVRVQATAVNPLSGLESLSRGASTVFGHAQIAMKMVPTPQHHVPKVMYTTGSCSEPIYSDTRAGIKGEFNHSLGALIVEKDGNRFHCRVVNADDDGGFYDLNRYYGPNGVEENERVLALITGDEHAMFNDSLNREATYLAENSIVNVLKPEKLVRHDVFDGYSISHHNRKDPVIQYSKHKHGHHLVTSELELTARHIEDTTPEFAENVIVASNHHEHLLRWLKETHPIQEPWNMDAWFELWSLLKETMEFRETGVAHQDPFALWMAKRLNVPTRFLPRDSEMSIGGILIGFHGDQGANGSRGTLNQYAKLGAKTVIGHCLTAEHDVLTPEGWRPIADIAEGTSLLSYDWKNGRNVWAETTEKQEYGYTGRLIRIRHESAFDQEVTPNHKLLLKDGTTITVPEAVLTRSASELPITAPLPEISVWDPVDERTLRQIVAVCADGSFYQHSLSFNVKKERKKERLEFLFGEDLRQPQKTNQSNGVERRTVRMDSQSYKNITRWVTPTTEKKQLPAEFFEMSPKSRAIVLDELQYWDGTFQSPAGGQQFSSHKEAEARLVAGLATLQGYRTTLAKRSDSKGWIVSWCTNKDHTFVTTKEHDAARIGAWGATTRYVENEPVYCFTVKDTGCFWVRSQRTGLISLTHNSHTPGIKHGCYQVGTSSTLRMDYTKGPSSWAHCHCVIYPNGKRQLIFVIDGHWRRED